jgi:hypothetical protein
MVVGTQFIGSLPAHQTNRWFTFNWPQEWNVIWTVLCTTPVTGAPQISWSVAVERASAADITYWISIENLSGAPVNIEARYAITNI